MRNLGKRARALAMIAAAIASGIPVVAPSANGNTVVPVQPTQQKDQQQAPIPARAQAIVAELAGGFKYYRHASASGIPWPGRAAARARHRAGSGRRPS